MNIIINFLLYFSNLNDLQLDIVILLSKVFLFYCFSQLLLFFILSLNKNIIFKLISIITVILIIFKLIKMLNLISSVCLINYEFNLIYYFLFLIDSFLLYEYLGCENLNQSTNGYLFSTNANTTDNQQSINTPANDNDSEEESEEDEDEIVYKKLNFLLHAFEKNPNYRYVTYFVEATGGEINKIK